MLAKYDPYLWWVALGVTAGLVFVLWRAWILVKEWRRRRRRGGRM